MNAAVPEEAFREVLVRGGWYRLGGVVDASGRRIADDIKRWAEAELAARDDDMQALADDFAGRGLRATRFNGKTHYRVAATGDGPTDFLQLEIEELQEVACHPLFAGDAPPSDIEEIVDPAGPCDGQDPLGAPFLVERRITDIADFLARMRAQRPEPQPVHRFVEDWRRSGAGAATPFASHWVFAVREHLDRYRQCVLNATPVATLNGPPPRFESVFGAQGLALHEALKRFDCQAGYPMAWFFHMLTTKTVPHAVASAAIEDVQAGFRYLPDRDVQVVRDWLHRPYGF
ncbi:MAG: hypothetical protein OHM77_01975 [Candidatus Nitricoxidivorans perseverans]|uniref:Uncharacterized protein n=1 Tax=Candidatus Nitricoxidivorans perseverans TaxID=2975601 RepID=A0AA49FM69_9PROT|nr:MAG: hypothetical protein OHM77_01975 [Candidatus Nitricoxidivorans perseverans]